MSLGKFLSRYGLYIVLKSCVVVPGIYYTGYLHGNLMKEYKLEKESPVKIEQNRIIYETGDKKYVMELEKAEIKNDGLEGLLGGD